MFRSPRKRHRLFLNLVSYDNHPIRAGRINVLKRLYHLLLEACLQGATLPGPDAKFHPEKFLARASLDPTLNCWRCDEDAWKLLTGGLHNGADSILDLLCFCAVTKKIDVRYGPNITAFISYYVGNGSTGDKRLRSHKIGQYGKADSYLLHNARLTPNFHHITHVAEIGENYRKSGYHILDQSLGTETYGKTYNGCTGKVGGE